MYEKKRKMSRKKRNRERGISQYFLLTESHPYTQQAPRIFHVLSSVLYPNDKIDRKPVSEVSITIDNIVWDISRLEYNGIRKRLIVYQNQQSSIGRN
jgi:hypothetical protein